MNKKLLFQLIIGGCVLLILGWTPKKTVTSVTVPFVLDHNRMLVGGEIQKQDGSWRKVLLWVDTGNPNFYLSSTLATDLGVDFSTDEVNPFVPPPGNIRIGGMSLDFKDVRTRVMLEPHWLFTTMHNDANLPSTVLRRYHIVFDYPNRQLTLAIPGTIKPRGKRAPAHIHDKTGIVQIDGAVDGTALSFALDNGAAYSFISRKVLDKIFQKNPGIPKMTGTAGCANMWGWWPPEEHTLTVARLPEIEWGPVRLFNKGIVGVSAVFPNGPDLGDWYSQKTARPVAGFLGPNAFKGYRVEIDYANKAVYFEKNLSSDIHDLDIVGIALRPEKDNTYTVAGIVQKNGKPLVSGIELGDTLVQVGNTRATGATMGMVVDALRGKPGDVRILLLKRNGKQLRVEAPVARLL